MKIDFHSRKAKILVISFLTAAFAVTGGLAIQGHTRAAAYLDAISNSYQHAFAELTVAIYEVDTALQKLSYATSPALISSLCTELFGRTLSAQMAIGELPYGNVELEHTASFVAKVGDYAQTLSRHTAANGTCTDEERQNLRALSGASAALSQTLCDLQADINAGTITLDDFSQAEARLSAATEDGTHVLAGSAYQTTESEFPEVPSLVYDGPFSQHLDRRAPKMLVGKEAFTQEMAQAAAAAFLDVKPEVFTLSSSGEGNLPTWGFTATIEGGEVYLEVTRKGGMVLSMINSRRAGTATVAPADAVNTALSFLAARGYNSLAPSYYINQGNILTINFAATQDGIICYPDLIKVSVALDTGRVVGYEAGGYLTNHITRALPPPAVTEDVARAAVGPDLKILAHQLAVIPTGGAYEVLCHEFKCETEDGKHYLIYVNAQSGNEEKILILLEDDTGTLVI